MKHEHNHDADINLNINIPKQDIESLIDKGRDAAVTIIMAFAIAHIVKGVFTPRS